MPIDEKRSLEITLSGEAIADGRVSVHLFTRTLQNIQLTIVELAKARLNWDPSKRGPIPSMLIRETELFLERVTPGSLHAVMTLPHKEETLFPDFPDLAERSLMDTRTVVEAIEKKNPGALESVIPIKEYRARVVSPTGPPSFAEFVSPCSNPPGSAGRVWFRTTGDSP